MTAPNINIEAAVTRWPELQAQLKILDDLLDNMRSTMPHDQGRIDAMLHLTSAAITNFVLTKSKLQTYYPGAQYPWNERK